MAYNITKNLQNALDQSSKDPQYILKIDGIDEIFGAMPVDITPFYDMFGLYYDMASLYYDRVFRSRNSRDWVDVSKSTNIVSQQIEPDKGAGTSTSQMTFEIVDVGGRMSEIISPGFVVEEILGRKATAYFMLKGDTSFPQDAIALMHGTIDDVVGMPGSVRITVSHPQNLLRQDFLPPWESKLTNFFHYKSTVIQDLIFVTRIPEGPIVYIRFLNVGSESVSVSGSQITVNIISGVTTADTVLNLVRNSVQAISLVDLSVIGNGTNPQTDTGGFISCGDSSTLEVESVEGFVMENADTIFQTYININDEILKVTNVNTGTNTITVSTAQRSLFNSAPPQIGEIGADVKSFYVFEGNALEMSLKLILSLNSPQIYEAQYYGKIPGLGYVANSVYFPGVNIKEEISLVEGDIIDLDTIFTGRTILNIVTTETDSWVIVSGSSIGDGDGPLNAIFYSKYNTLPVGCSVDQIHVDVERFEEILTQYNSSIPDYRFFITDSINMKDFLEKEIFFPSGLYLCPRKGRISCSIARPAIGGPSTKYLTENNVLEPESRAIVRSLNQNFYNAINWYFDEDSINRDDFLSKVITVNSDSVQRFNVGVRPLIIQSKGLRSDLNANSFLQTITRRFLDRYKFAAEMIHVKVNLGVGIPIEIADTVVYGSPDVQIPDITQGSRNFQPRVWEVINKELSPSSVNLILLETKYGTEGRFGIISPNSIVAPSSTLTKINIQKSFGTGEFDFESEKWADFIGQNIMIRTLDWGTQLNCVLTGVDEVTGTSINVSGLSIIPAAGMIVDLPKYNDSSSSIDVMWKNIFCFFDPQVTIVSGVSATEFEVGPSDIGKFTVGLTVRVHNQSFSIDSGDGVIKVSGISGNFVTVNKSLGFTPSAGQKVDLIGFIDGGKPYLLV